MYKLPPYVQEYQYYIPNNPYHENGREWSDYEIIKKIEVQDWQEITQYIIDYQDQDAAIIVKPDYDLIINPAHPY